MSNQLVTYPKPFGLPFVEVINTSSSAPNFTIPTTMISSFLAVDSSNTAVSTWALPALDELIIGEVLVIFNPTVYILTLTPNGSDVINGADTYVVPSGAKVELVIGESGWIASATLSTLPVPLTVQLKVHPPTTYTTGALPIAASDLANGIFLLDAVAAISLALPTSPLIFDALFNVNSPVGETALVQVISYGTTGAITLTAGDAQTTFGTNALINAAVGGPYERILYIVYQGTPTTPTFIIY
jgi:hypothetical protein